MVLKSDSVQTHSTCAGTDKFVAPGVQNSHTRRSMHQVSPRGQVFNLQFHFYYIFMSRPLRILYPNALYHITVRGNQKKDIFINDEDRKLLLSIIERTVYARNILCYAYCFMPNHFHLVIETPEANLSSAMRDINGMYTQAYHKIHKTVGHIFQGRYKSFLIEKELYLFEVIRYTVLNPVRANLVDRPGDWFWSSFLPTMGRFKSAWFNSELVLDLFSSDKKIAKIDFEKFVNDGISEESPFKKVKEGMILGSPQFCDDVWGRVRSLLGEKEFVRKDRMIGRPKLDDVFIDISNKLERDEAIIFSKFRCGYSSTEIARHLKMSRSMVSYIVRSSIVN